MDFQLKVGPTTQDARIETARTLCTQGENLIRAGNFEGALQSFSQAADIFPEYARAKNALGVIYVFKGDWNKAAGYFSEAFNLIPDDPVITLNVGKFLERVSKPEEAIKIYQSYLGKKHDQDISQELTRLKTASPIPAVSIQKDMSRKRQIIFIADMLPFIPRVPKFAYGLKQNGWDVVLLHRNSLNFDPKKYFVETRQYGSPDEAAELAASYHPLAYHVFSSWYFNTAAAVIRRKPGKIVFDDYDVMAGMVKEDFARRHYPGQLELERLCLENADGLCCRSLHTQYAKRYMGYCYHGKRILVVDGCWSNHPIPTKSERQNDKNFHIVYCGNISSTRSDYHIFRLCESLSAQEIHFHIYPGFYIPENFLSDYTELSRRSPFFHIHKPVHPDKLGEEMAQYDVGWFDLRAFETDLAESYNKLLCTHYGGTNKIFDYIDAGLPILINAPRFVEMLLKYVRVSIKIDEDFINNPRGLLNQIDWNSLKKNVIQAQSLYSVSRQAQRLGAFYSAL